MRGGWDRALILFDLPSKYIGFSVGPRSILFLVWNPKCLVYIVGSTLFWLLGWGM